MEELKAEAQARGLWNLFLPDAELRAGPHQPRVRAAVRAHGPLAPVAGGHELLGARHRQHGGARRVRDAAAAGAVPPAAARRRDPLVLRDDRAVGRELRRHQHLESHRARRRPLRDQRAQVVDERRGVVAVHVRDPHGRLGSRRRPAPAPHHGARAARHAGRHRSCARCRCSATTPAAGTARRSSRTCASPPSTCSARRAAGSPSRRPASVPAASTTACARSGWPSVRSQLMCERAQQRVAFGKHLADQGVIQERDRRVAHRDRAGAPAHDEGGVAHGHRRHEGRPLRDRRDQGGRGAPRDR